MHAIPTVKKALPIRPILPLAALLSAVVVCVAAAPPSAMAQDDHLIPPIPDLEAPPAGERADIDAAVWIIIGKVLKDFLIARASDPAAIAVRDAHPKAHGCVRGELSVHDALAGDLHTSVFSPGARYPAWVRFSNATGADAADRNPDARGMAIKLLQVPGPKLMDGVFAEHPWFVEEPSSQDFVFINHPVFFTADVRTYLAFTRALSSDSLLQLISFFVQHPRELGIAAAILAQPAYNPLELDYHSMTPFLFGSGRAAKFSAIPVSCLDGTPVEATPRSRDDHDYLREAMAESLDENDGEPVCFDIRAALRLSDEAPIEDATVLWDEAAAPPASLATLRIAPQRFDIPQRDELCENLSFMPWHSVPEHQPLGGLNRARLHAYKAISDVRHWLNRVPAEEPFADDGL